MSHFETTLQLKTTILNTSFQLFDYITTRPHLFAIALHQELGYPIEFMWNSDFKFKDESAPRVVLIHAYCVLPNHQYLDARGYVSHDLIAQEKPHQHAYYERVSSKQIEKLTNLGRLCKEELLEIDSLRDFIKEHVHVYS
ncbi:hypothetical protein ABEP17_08595 [Priestia flexa]|uniref:Uncharacterized protein n=1 Tax=Priestia veravalensis TaxID=1414648 RepID=A0A0V8JKZ4_9BACI|nr:MULTISPECIES: hypothetical protein [Priestia]KSU87533.1 hypothetical protein AS180_12440 [Priestia veravalensis]MCA1201987.1 hypothetical protein [Priestia flexa]MCG7314633.1 hypothetical protein [Priestia flexa]MEC0667275.1 hypothetical protein [Priestia flexa]MED3824980.1 hypothetical protein [Priestia flexa]